jgi:hypothetical protein
MPNGVRSIPMSPAERLDEVARLLALGYLRLRARRRAEKANDPNQLRNFGLDFRGEGSVCDTDAHGQRRRRWRGVTHEVMVIDGGYEHQGKRYRSLSAIARAITGTQWSGPLFFGLRKTRSGA